MHPFFFKHYHVTYDYKEFAKLVNFIASEM